jgi:integrase/recombinase XerD
MNSEKFFFNNSFFFNEDSFLSFVEKFLIQSDISLNSRLTYKRSMNVFINWCKKKFLFNSGYIPTRELILEYKSFLLYSEIRPFTKSLYLTCIKQFFSWADSNFVFPNITSGIKGIKRLTKQHHKDSLKKEDISKLFNSIDTSNIVGLRDYTLIYLLVHTGLRLIEVSSILITDMEFNTSNENVILWIRGKGRDGKDSFVVLIEEVFFVLKRYLDFRKTLNINSNFLFFSHSTNTKNKVIKKFSTSSISRIIRNRLKAVNLKTKRISAHSLRHTFGVMAINAGVSLYDLQLAMRHSSPSTTQIYLGDIEHAKRMHASPERKISDFLKS